MATCGHPTPTGPCKRTVADKGGTCFMHSGNGTPPGHGAQAGNQNAVGNAGGGAPVGNANAAKYHGWSDPRLHYERLEGDAKAHVDKTAEWYVDCTTADLPQSEIKEKARLLATLEHQSWLSMAETLDSGLAVERTREVGGEEFAYSAVNPAAKAEFRLYSKEWDLRDELELVYEQGDE